MMINIGLEYDACGYIKSAMWWKFGERPAIEEYAGYNIINVCVYNGDSDLKDHRDLYGLATVLSNDTDELCGKEVGEVEAPIIKIREVLMELLFDKEPEAARSASKSLCWKRTIKIRHFTKVRRETKNTNTDSGYVLSQMDIERLQNAANRVETVRDNLKHTIPGESADILNIAYWEICNVLVKINKAKG